MSDYQIQQKDDGKHYVVDKDGKPVTGQANSSQFDAMVERAQIDMKQKKTTGNGEANVGAVRG